MTQKKSFFPFSLSLSLSLQFLGAVHKPKKRTDEEERKTEETRKKRGGKEGYLVDVKFYTTVDLSGRARLSPPCIIIIANKHGAFNTHRADGWTERVWLRGN